MKDTTLKSLSEVVDITTWLNKDIDDLLKLIWEYNDFIKQPLKIEMFIPCNDGVPLEEPKDFKVFLEWKKDRDVFSKAYLKKCEEYQKAKDKVLFKGFRVVSNKNGSIRIENNKIYLEFYGKVVNWSEGQIKSIQDLEGKVDLTDKEYKLLNL